MNFDTLYLKGISGGPPCCVTMVCAYHQWPVAFQQIRVPNSFPMGANYVDCVLKELQWSQSTYRLPPKEWLIVDQPHQNNSSSSVGNSNHKPKSFKLNTIYYKTHSQLNLRTRIKHKLQTFNKVTPFEYKFNSLSLYITEHHKIQSLDLSEHSRSKANWIPVQVMETWHCKRHLNPVNLFLNKF